jgi:hypothetical protein
MSSDSIMNPFLAQMYGTGTEIGAAPEADDTEKLAQAQLLDEMFAKEEINYSDMDPATAVKVAQTLFGEATKITEDDVKNAQVAEKQASAQTPAEEPAKEAGAAEGSPEFTQEDLDKIAQADFAGRVMAHSYWQEKTALEKAAAEAEGKEKTCEKCKKDEGKCECDEGGDKKPLPPFMSEKKASTALDMLAEKRAAEILAANGIKPEEAPAQGPTGAEKLAASVEARALELIQAKGFKVEK